MTSIKHKNKSFTFAKMRNKHTFLRLLTSLAAVLCFVYTNISWDGVFAYQEKMSALNRLLVSSKTLPKDKGQIHQAISSETSDFCTYIIKIFSQELYKNPERTPLGLHEGNLDKWKRIYAGVEENWCNILEHGLLPVKKLAEMGFEGVIRRQTTYYPETVSLTTLPMLWDVGNMEESIEEFPKLAANSPWGGKLELSISIYVLMSRLPDWEEEYIGVAMCDGQTSYVPAQAIIGFVVDEKRIDASVINKNVRPLTTQERGSIQTFPSDFVWVGKKTDLEQIIGNAVPVKLAEFVGKCIVEYLSENKKTRKKTILF